MKIRFAKYDLNLKHTFTVSSYSRNHTPAIIVRIDESGLCGYGEASMPQYLVHNENEILEFLSTINIDKFDIDRDFEELLEYISSFPEKLNPGKAALDIAAHDLYGKIKGKSWVEIKGYDKTIALESSFTIGIDSPEMIKIKIAEASEFNILKIKLGRDNDKEIISTIRNITDKPIFADINQGWKNKESALENIFFLKENNVRLIEQPMPENCLDEIAWLTERSPLPVIADESCRTVEDFYNIKDCFHGINVKLMKTGGIRNAEKLIQVARKSGKKIMLGCMTETSCGISAASQIISFADYADLDGNLLIENDPFEGAQIRNGRISASDVPGIGIKSVKFDPVKGA